MQLHNRWKYSIQFSQYVIKVSGKCSLVLNKVKSMLTTFSSSESKGASLESEGSEYVLFIPIFSPVSTLSFGPLQLALTKRLCCLVSKSCLTLYNPMYCSLLGSSICGIFQARILEWIAIPGSSLPRDRTHISYTGRQILYH